MENQTKDRRRKHARISLRTNKYIELLLACDGVTVTLKHLAWWRFDRIGLANIKDISRGGVGLISVARLSPGQQLKIQFDDIELPIEITRYKQIEGALKFYGACYLNVSDTLLLQAMKRVRVMRRKYRFPKK